MKQKQNNAVCCMFPSPRQHNGKHLRLIRAVDTATKTMLSRRGGSASQLRNVGKAPDRPILITLAWTLGPSQ